MSFTRRKLLASLGALAAIAGLSAFWISRMTNYDGPVSDHFDGNIFFDPDGVPPKTLGEVLRWQFGGGRNRQVWPDWMENQYADTPPPRVETGVRLSYVGHASWLIQSAGQNLLIDPVWSDRVSPFSFAGPK